jgi:signal transduction histidine kinase
VLAHGGQIALVDNEGGATFRVTIPDVVIDIGRARRSA